MSQLVVNPNRECSIKRLRAASRLREIDCGRACVPNGLLDGHGRDDWRFLDSRQNYLLKSIDTKLRSRKSGDMKALQRYGQRVRLARLAKHWTAEQACLFCRPFR